MNPDLQWVKSAYLVGHGTGTQSLSQIGGLRSKHVRSLFSLAFCSSKQALQQAAIVDDFRNGKTNLLICTVCARSSSHTIS